MPFKLYKCLAFIAVLTLLFTGAQSAYAQKNPVAKSNPANEKQKTDRKIFWNVYQTAKSYQTSNFKKADSIRKPLLEMGINLGDTALYWSKVYHAEIDFLHGDLEAYYNQLEELKDYQNQFSPLNIKLDYYQRMGDYHLYQRQFQKGIIYFQDALKISKKLHINAQISKTFCLISKGYMLMNLKDSAITYSEAAKLSARRSANNLVKADAFHNQADIYEHFGVFSLSVNRNLTAIDFAEQEGDKYRLAKYHISVGEAQMSAVNLKHAESHFIDAIEMAKDIKDLHSQALANINLGMVYTNYKNYDQAIIYLKEALKLLANYNDYDGLGNAHNCLGDIYREQKDFSKAVSYYNKALVDFESSGNREKSATVYHNVGFVFEKQGKYFNALNYLNRSVEIRSNFGYKGSIYPTYLTISEVYQKTGNKDLAYKYLKMYAVALDSAKMDETAEKIAEMENSYINEKKDKILIAQKEKAAANKAKYEKESLKNDLQKIIIIGFIIFMLLAGIIGFYRWNQTKIKQQQQQAEMNQTLLRAQMNPHFVFNAMSVIQSYIYDNDTKNSAKFLINFSKLMRLILENSSKEFIPIKTEFEILDKYLNIQKLRFEERFEFSILVDENLYDEDAVIPPMITQPFIENAIEHGRLHLREDGFINIHFFKFENMLRITVEDNGVGRKGAELNKKSKEHKSMAMKITKDRIDNMNKKYRSDGFMLIEDFNKMDQTGTKVLISIPYRVNNQI